MSKLDAKDQALLRALAENARSPVVRLAQTIGLSRSATHERLSRLEARGIIEGYSVRVRDGFRPAGLQAIITVSCNDNVVHDHVVERMVHFAGVRSVRCVGGEIDTILDVECADIDALDALRARVVAIDGVRRATTYPVLKTRVAG